MAENQSLHIAIVELLGRSAMDQSAIVDALVATGATTGSPDVVRDTVARLLQFDTSFSELAAGIVHLPSLLEGTRWTVWVDADDAAKGFVRGCPNLEPLIWWLIGGDVNAVDATGATIGLIETDGMWLDDVDTDVVILPKQILAVLSGGWATVTVTRGGLHWERCATPPEPDPRQVDALRAGFGRSADAESQLGIDERPPQQLRFASGEGPIHEAIVVDRAAFVNVPVAPLADMYRAAGIEQRGQVLAEPGFDWDALESWQASRRLSFRYGLDPTQLQSYEGLLAALDAFVAGTDSAIDADATIVAALDDSAICAAFWDACLERETEMDVLARFAAGVVDRSAGRVLAGVGWLHARALDWSGRSMDAAHLLAQLISDGATHILLFEDVATFSADRGDAKSAYRLLQAAGVEPYVEDEDAFGGGPDAAQMLLDEITHWATHRPRATAARNDRCPCGSGRKYKACHLGREEFPLSEHAVWLYEKAKRFMRLRGAAIASEIAETMAGDEVDLFDELIESAIVADVTLHEGGVLAEFLSARGELLPDGERILAARWTVADRGVFEVTAVGADRLELHDVGSGSDITVVNVTSSDRTRVGSFLVGRPLPVGEDHRSFGGFVPIATRWVTPFIDAIASGDPFEVATAYGALFAPPAPQDSPAEDDGL